MLPSLIKKIKAAPKNPGVYIFLKDKVPLYVGKASELKNRLGSYLRTTNHKTEALHKEANKLKLINLNSNIEALIVESQLIKSLKPKYNILWRDDKNYFYVEITKERFPKIRLTHQPNARTRSRKLMAKYDYIGPFTDGGSLKAILKLLRRYFPYCTCKPHLRQCLNSQINNCPGYCCKKNVKPAERKIASYKKIIRGIKGVLTGKNKKFIREIKDPYELLILKKIWEHEPYLKTSSIRHSTINRRKNILCLIPRTLTANKVECYDNSHLSGKEAVGAMTVWTRQEYRVAEGLENYWAADKNSWRKFKIRGKYTEDDPRMMKEIITRRLNHSEWSYPDLIIVDGGITQWKAAQRAISKLLTASRLPPRKNRRLPKIISFAKPEQKIYGLEKSPAPLASLPVEFQNLIKTAIQNTHNFVIRYHRKVRERKLLSANKLKYGL